MRNSRLDTLISALSVTVKRVMSRIRIRSIILGALLVGALGALPARWASAQTAAVAAQAPGRPNADLVGGPQPVPAVSARSAISAPHRKLAGAEYSGFEQALELQATAAAGAPIR